MTKSEISISQAQSQVDQWINEIGVRYFNELSNMAILTEEVGELARLMVRQYGEQSFKQPISQEEIKIKIGEEIGDVFFVLVCLANQMSIDLADVFEKGMIKRNTRDKHRHIKNQKLK